MVMLDTIQKSAQWYVRHERRTSLCLGLHYVTVSVAYAYYVMPGYIYKDLSSRH